MEELDAADLECLLAQLKTVWHNVPADKRDMNFNIYVAAKNCVLARLSQARFVKVVGRERDFGQAV